MLVMFPLNHENGQILRTKRWLYEALGDLMQEKPFSAITVGQICKRADVSRAVFYNHYTNKEELLLEIFKRIMTVYWRKVQLEADEAGYIRSRTAYTILCKELWRSRAFLRQLYFNNYSYLLIEFFEQVHDKVYSLISRKAPPKMPEYRKYFLPYHASALATLMFQWLCDQEPLPVEQMADMALRLFRSVNVDSFLEYRARQSQPPAKTS